MHLQLGLLQWGSLQRSPDPLAGGEGFAAPSPTTLSPQPVSLRLWILTIRVLGVHPKTNFWLRFCSQRQLSAKFWKLSGNTPCYCSIHAASHVPQHHSACGSQHFDTVALVRSVFYVHVCCLLTHAFYETNELMKLAVLMLSVRHQVVWMLFIAAVVGRGRGAAAAERSSTVSAGRRCRPTTTVHRSVRTSFSSFTDSSSTMVM